MANYFDELKIAKQAARSAAQIIREYGQKHSYTIDFKGSNNLVTNADLAAEYKIIEIIKNRFPDDQIMAEETEQKQFLPEDRTWIIDPIDGTTNFVHEFPIFCVSIALWKSRQPKVGLVLEVNSDECFEAVAGKGAFLNNENIQVSGLKKSRHAMIGTGFPYNDKSFSDEYLNLFKWLLHNTQSIRRPGSAAFDLCCVAAGRFDGFYEHSLQPWDVGAAALIIKEAGGIITDWEGGDNWLLGRHVVAGNKTIHSFLLKAIQLHYKKGVMSNEELESF